LAWIHKQNEWLAETLGFEISAVTLHAAFVHANKETPGLMCEGP